MTLYDSVEDRVTYDLPVQKPGFYTRSIFLSCDDSYVIFAQCNDEDTILLCKELFGVKFLFAQLYRGMKAFKLFN